MGLIAGRADAVLIPSSMKKGQRSIQRIDSISILIAEPILGVVRSKGERSYIRECPHYFAPDKSCYLLVTRSPLDTLLYGSGHAQRGQHRYRWEDDGMIKIGYIIDESEKDIREYHTFPG